MERSRLLYLKISGFKSIDKPIELFFANKTFDVNLFNHSLVKGIYGTNGAGKTAIAEALNLYKNFCLDPGYISIKNYDGYFANIISKKEKKASIEIVFSYLNGDIRLTYKHSVSFRINPDDAKSLEITSESMDILSNENWYSGNNKHLIATNGESITYLDNSLDTAKNELYKNSQNVIKYQSVLVAFITSLSPKPAQSIFNKEVLLFLVAMFNSLTSLYIYLDESDKHYLSEKKIRKLWNNLEIQTKSKKGIGVGFYGVYSSDEDEILVIDYSQYESKIKQVTKFLQIFKPNLLNIEIDKRPNGDKYICRKNLVYKGGYSVNSEFESNGIKKLMQLYSFLNAAMDGNIVFIDEFDANIHDIYLCKLIDYFMYHSKCQLCFTTHNLGPMEILKDNTHSIDFLEKSTIVSWATNGNYSPVNVYRSGMIENSPFNLDGSDFAGVFGGNK